MSSKMCQGLQSCVETQSLQPWATSLQLAPQNSHFLQSLKCLRVTPFMSDSDLDSEEHEKSNNTNGHNNTNTNNNRSNCDFGGWCSIETTLVTKVEEKATLYVHPLAKRSSSMLSMKSLQLCTENLGSETGSDIGDNNEISSPSSSDTENGMSPTRERTKPKKVNRRSFPPPLTSISNSDGLHFRPHREGGRLVIKAVSIVPSQACFEAERGDGRLRLRFTKIDDAPSFKQENDDNKDSDEIKNEEEDDEDKQEEDGQQETECYLAEEIEGNNGNYQRPFRCKEGRHGKKGLLQWEPFLSVATT